MKTLIKNARTQKDWKIKDLAQQSGIDQALISKYENGKRIPSKQHVYLLADALELGYDDIMIQWLKTKILEDVADEQYAIPAMDEVLHELRESRAKYTKSQRKYHNADILDEYKALLSKKRPLDSAKISEALGLEYTYESNRIEGNTLTLSETNLIISEGMTISGKSMREHLEALNHQEAIQFIQEAVRDHKTISEGFIKNLHYLVLKGIDPENAGKYRQVQVMITGSAHMPPQPYIVPARMKELMSWYRTHLHKLHPVVLAAEMHQRLVTIHPFIDGNGRTSRLLMNLILMQHGYVIANIKGDLKNRLKYYEVLESSQSDPDKKEFVEFIIDVESDCLRRYLEILGTSL